MWGFSSGNQPAARRRNECVQLLASIYGRDYIEDSGTQDWIFTFRIFLVLLRETGQNLESRKGKEKSSPEFLSSRFKLVRNGELERSSYPLDHSRRSRAAGLPITSSVDQPNHFFRGLPWRGLPWRALRLGEEKLPHRFFEA